MLERGEQPAVVALVEPDRRLVEDVHDAGEPGADLGGEPDALGLAAGQGLRRTIEREVFEPHVHQEGEPRRDLVDDPLGDRSFLAGQGERAEERERVAQRQGARLEDGFVADLDVPGFALQARAGALRTGLAVDVFRQLLAHDNGVGLLVAPLEVRDHALEVVLAHEGLAALVEVGERDLLLGAVEHDLLHRRRQPLERAVDVELEMRRQAREHLEVELVAPVPALDRTGSERQLRVRDDALRVEELDRPEAVALRACAHRVVEREEPRLELRQRVAADRAREPRREEVLLAAVRLERDGAAVGVAQRRLERLGEALLRVGAGLEAVDHDLDRVLRVLRELRQGLDIVDLPVDAQAHEPLRAQLVEEIRLLALAAGDDRRQDHQLRVLRQREHVVDHLRHRLRLEREQVVGAVGGADAREKKAQVVVDLGDRADGGARVVRGRLLLDRDRRGQALDQVDVRLLHELQELARVRRQRLDVAPLAFGVERVERKRRLARPGQAGDHHELVAREVEAEVLEVVRACAADANLVHAAGGAKGIR